jgi:hypothetical protein
MAPPSPVALFKCPAFAAQSRSVLDGPLSPIRKCRAALSESPRLIRPPLVLTQSRSLSKKRPGGPSPVLQYATTTFFPMRKPCRSRSQVRSLRAYRQTNGPCDQVIPGSKTFSVEQHPSADETVKICACPVGPRTRRRCLSPKRSQESSGPPDCANVHSTS